MDKDKRAMYGQECVIRVFLSIFAMIVLMSCRPSTTPSTSNPVVVEVTREVTAQSVVTQVEVTREIEVTRNVEVTRSVPVIPAPAPLLAEKCHQTAMTTAEINACALLEYELSIAEMDKYVAQIKTKMTSEEQNLFNDLQEGWLAQMERDCEFFFGRIGKMDDGTLYYEWGSMAPMRVASCEAGRTKDRTLELRQVYLCSNFHCGDE